MVKFNKETHVNEALRRAREERGWTQKMLADKMGVAEQTVSSWERQLRFPSTQLKVLLCEVLGKTIEELDLIETSSHQGQEPLSEIDMELSQEQDAEQRSDLEFEQDLERVVGEKQDRKEGQDLQRDREPKREEEAFYQFAEKEEGTQQRVQPVISQVTFVPFERAENDRQRMLKRVQSYWISSVFHPVSNALLMTLTLQMRPNAISRPGRTQIPVLHHDSWGRMPPGTKITDIYEEADGALLILGEPGAGKTTLLLELTRSLLERASIDDSQPIPVVFQLSSWTEKCHTLEEWLIQELNTSYLIPMSLARTWVVHNQISPLLDGLDEVKSRARSACVEAINTYRQEHGFVSIAICCRSSDYAALPFKLMLTSSVLIKPLSPQQIDDYLVQGGTNLAAVRTALQIDPMLQHMASTPLMLRILALAYQDMSIEEVLAVDNQEERRRMVFEQYVQRAIERKASQTYSMQTTIQRMSWLAQHMQAHNQNEFYLEHLQPDWLESRMQTRYRNTVIRVVFGINFFIDAGLFACFRGDSEPDQPGLFYWLGGHGFGNTILGWMSPGLGGGLKGGASLAMMIFLAEVIVVLIAGQGHFTGNTRETFYRLFHGFISALPIGFLFGLIVAIGSGALFTAIYDLADGFVQGGGTGLFEGILVWLMIGLIRGLSPGQHSARIKKEHVRWTHHYFRFRSLVDRLINCVLFMVCAMLGMTSIYSLQAQTIQPSFLLAGTLLGMGIGAVFGLGNTTELMPDLGVTIKPAETVAWSWQRVSEHLAANIKAGLLLGGAIAFPTVLSLSVASSIFYGPSYAWRYGLIYGLIFGLVNGVAAILTGILNSGWSSDVLSDDQRQYMQPDQGTRNSLKHAWFSASRFGPIGGIVGGLCCGLCFWLAGVPGWPILILGFILIYSIVFSIRFWTAYGGRAFIEHLVLRWYLARAGVLPWKGISFLDYAAECSLLHKVGGGYIFAHRLLLDYFAHISDRTMKDERIKKNI